VRERESACMYVCMCVCVCVRLSYVYLRGADECKSDLVKSNNSFKDILVTNIPNTNDQSKGHLSHTDKPHMLNDIGV
jgi:hypothetical protein